MHRVQSYSREMMRIESQDHPKVQKVNREELSAMLERLDGNRLTKEDRSLIANMAETLEFILKKLQDKDVRLKHLLKQIFGIKSEKSSKVFEEVEGKASPNPSRANSDPKAEEKEAEQKPKGHGRNGAKAYTGAKTVQVEHRELSAGQACPTCKTGKLYRVKTPGVFIHIEGRPPIDATVYKIEKLRCNLCGEVFQADSPITVPDNSQKYYDESAKSMIVLLRYGHGFPLNRLEKLQLSLGIPLPASTAYDKIEEVAKKVMSVHEELMNLAAQAELIHNDDTGMRVLKTVAEIEQEVKDAGGKKTRTGIFTTGIVCIVGGKKIALFFTGRQHAGENLDDLMKARDGDRSDPIQMCDGKAGNTLPDTPSIVCNCNAHARRYFVDASENFPDECAYVILDVYKEVYKNDKHCKDENMSPEQRLRYHREHSQSIIDEFHEWLERQLSEKCVEPNGELGKAISYTLKHWQQLTRFLQIAGAPLDNNVCEQMLKMAICHRKNSLFYKTANGARIGDMFMGIIHTCHYAKVDAFDYLTQLQRHETKVLEDPSKWLPWNYREQVDLLNKSHAKTR